MVWEDERHGNLEVYYASVRADSVLREIRVTNTRAESSYPCIACHGDDVFVLWQEMVEDDFEIYYVRLRNGTEMARKQLTETELESACPGVTVGPGGELHLTWHEGPFKWTGVLYGKVVGDSLVEQCGVCIDTPAAFRPDIACDAEGRVLIAWYHDPPVGDIPEVRSRFWDGDEWGEIETVSKLESRPWRLSVAHSGGDRWAVAWFDRISQEHFVYTSTYDGSVWSAPAVLNTAKAAYYPSVIATGAGDLAVAWETRDNQQDFYAIRLRHFDGKSWSDGLQIYRHKMAGRYISMASEGNRLHAVYFSSMEGNDEIYYVLMRSD
jgi:hypothetical protein